MSKETVLKKEFQKKDVERLRNLNAGLNTEKKPVLVLVLQTHKNFIMREIFGSLMVELGLLQMVLNKI